MYEYVVEQSQLCLSCLYLLSKDKVDRQDEAGKSCEVIPAQGVALDEQHRKECKDHQRDNLLNDLQLPEGEGTSEFCATDAVGWHLEAVLKEGDAPTDKYDSNDAVALKLRLEGYMAIPRQRHKDIGADEQSDCRYSLDQHTILSFSIMVSIINRCRGSVLQCAKLMKNR